MASVRELARTTYNLANATGFNHSKDRCNGRPALQQPRVSYTSVSTSFHNFSNEIHQCREISMLYCIHSEVIDHTYQREDGDSVRTR